MEKPEPEQRQKAPRVDRSEGGPFSPARRIMMAKPRPKRKEKRLRNLATTKTWMSHSAARSANPGQRSPRRRAPSRGGATDEPEIHQQDSEQGEASQDVQFPDASAEGNRAGLLN